MGAQVRLKIVIIANIRPTTLPPIIKPVIACGPYEKYCDHVYDAVRRTSSKLIPTLFTVPCNVILGIDISITFSLKVLSENIGFPDRPNVDNACFEFMI